MKATKTNIRRNLKGIENPDQEITIMSNFIIEMATKLYPWEGASNSQDLPEYLLEETLLKLIKNGISVNSETLSIIRLLCEQVYKYMDTNMRLLRNDLVTFQEQSRILNGITETSDRCSFYSTTYYDKERRRCILRGGKLDQK